ncbi:unnamed protein product [Owenia fusiformis]|uniref:PHD finger protein 14 n=1 Tax=Owenia fusiformis TaxID=6347 RepID=A0A8S4MZP0_OWEFU|nr:unnamed protein product [Owenia fusiformis]
MADEDADDATVGFLYKTMLNRDPRKRRVKPVSKHMIQLDFGLEDSSDDSDYQVKQGSDDDDVDDDFDDDEDSDGDGVDDNTDKSGSDNESVDEKSDIEKEITFDNIGSDDSDDEDYIPDDAVSMEDVDKSREKREKLQAESKASVLSVDGSTGTPARFKVLICCVCQGEDSEESDEIVECDGCGITVHEGCYGVCESTSVASTESSASTEPWFCDACKAGVKPNCELCPNTSGIFKETDAGRWVHLVCALYIPGIAFADVDQLSSVTLFEMPYARWGARECSLCEDSRFSRTGVCISCDAGMCRSYFHVTCAQREGLLSEASPDEEIADPFFAHCKQHADKLTTRRKRRNFLAIQSRMKQHTETEIEDEKENLRVHRKLHRHRQKYLISRAKRPPSWVPDEKQPRLLTTCPAAVRRLLHKAELMGISTQAVDHMTNKSDLRKKGGQIQPAMSVEFVAYFLDRNNRIANMKKHSKELLAQNRALTVKEKILRQKYEKLCDTNENLKCVGIPLRNKAEQLHKHLCAISGKQLALPEILKVKKPVRPPTTTQTKDTPRSPPAVIHKCGRCGKTHDQHLLAKCDNCRLYFHLGCLDPPLTRMPKKTRLMGWQCSECTRSSSEDSEEERIDTEAPRKLREKGQLKQPKKYSHLEDQNFVAFHKEKPQMVGVAKSKKKLPFKRPVPTSTESKSRVPLPGHPALTKPSPVNPIKKVKAWVQPPTEQPQLKKQKLEEDFYEPVVITTELSNALVLEDHYKQPPASRSKVFEDYHRPPEAAQRPKVEELSRPVPRPKVVKPKVQRGPVEVTCVTCAMPGTTKTCVKCDECRKYYHFQCLDPPSRRTPKQHGYAWHCAACDLTSSDSSNDNKTPSPLKGKPKLQSHAHNDSEGEILVTNVVPPVQKSSVEKDPNFIRKRPRWKNTRCSLHNKKKISPKGNMGPVTKRLNLTMKNNLSLATTQEIKSMVATGIEDLKQSTPPKQGISLNGNQSVQQDAPSCIIDMTKGLHLPNNKSKRTLVENTIEKIKSKTSKTYIKMTSAPRPRIITPAMKKEIARKQAAFTASRKSITEAPQGETLNKDPNIKNITNKVETPQNETDGHETKVSVVKDVKPESEISDTVKLESQNIQENCTKRGKSEENVSCIMKSSGNKDIKEIDREAESNTHDTDRSDKHSELSAVDLKTDILEQSEKQQNSTKSLSNENTDHDTKPNIETNESEIQSKNIKDNHINGEYDSEKHDEKDNKDVTDQDNSLESMEDSDMSQPLDLSAHSKSKHVTAKSNIEAYSDSVDENEERPMKPGAIKDKLEITNQLENKADVADGKVGMKKPILDTDVHREESKENETVEH